MHRQVLVFGVDGSELRTAVERGVMALGYSPRVQVPHAFSRSQAIEAESLAGVFTIGLRGGSGEAAYHYASLGLPVGCLDYAHLRRPGEVRWRLTSPSIDWLPDFGDAAIPTDRLDRLGVEISSRRRVKGQVVLLVGQTSEDSAHGMPRSDFERWAIDALARIRSVTDSRVVWRPHPRETWELPGADGYSDPDVETLDEALAKSWLVVTYNSTVGLDALVAGLPVVAEGPCVYKHLAGSVSAMRSLEPASGPELRELLAKLAWGQWTIDEVRSGEPLNLFVPDADGSVLTYTDLAARYPDAPKDPVDTGEATTTRSSPEVVDVALDADATIDEDVAPIDVESLTGDEADEPVVVPAPKKARRSRGSR